MHTKPGVAENFINDVESIVNEMMKNPEKPVEGRMAIYGLAQSIPDRSIVGEFTKLYLDSLSFTPKKPKKIKKGEKEDEEKVADNQTESNDVTLMNEWSATFKSIAFVILFLQQFIFVVSIWQKIVLR